MFIEAYHEKVYDRNFNYLSSEWKEGSLYTFAKKKSEVLRCFLKTLSDMDLIQLISWSLPKECQRFVMSKLFTSIAKFLDAVEEYDESLIEEDEEENQNEDDEENEDENQNESEEDENVDMSALNCQD